jgi:hypothetical protein
VSAFIEEYRERFGVEPICETLGVSASAYYERGSGRRSVRAIEDERLLGVISELHERNYLAYGSRRMWKALLRCGEQVGRSRVERLMRQHGLQGAKRRGKPWRTTRPDPSALRSPDLVQRDFTASRPDELWFADFTYLRCWEGLVFFSFVIDAYSRKVVGWQFASHMPHHARSRRAEDGAPSASVWCRRRARAPLRRRQPIRIQLVLATVCCGRDRRCSSSASAGVRQPSVLRGLLLSVAATASSSSAVCLARFVPLGKYWRSRPLVFSFVPRCHGL